jgi:hypothetical protein
MISVAVLGAHPLNDRVGVLFKVRVALAVSLTNMLGYVVRVAKRTYTVVRQAARPEAHGGGAHKAQAEGEAQFLLGDWRRK